MTQKERYLKWVILLTNIANARREGKPVILSAPNTAEEDADMFAELSEMVSEVVIRIKESESK